MPSSGRDVLEWRPPGMQTWCPGSTHPARPEFVHRLCSTCPWVHFLRASARPRHARLKPSGRRSSGGNRQLGGVPHHRTRVGVQRARSWGSWAIQADRALVVPSSSRRLVGRCPPGRPALTSRCACRPAVGAANERTAGALVQQPTHVQVSAPKSKRMARLQIASLNRRAAHRALVKTLGAPPTRPHACRRSSPTPPSHHAATRHKHRARPTAAHKRSISLPLRPETVVLIVGVRPRRARHGQVHRRGRSARTSCKDLPTELGTLQKSGASRSLSDSTCSCCSARRFSTSPLFAVWPQPRSRGSRRRRRARASARHRRGRPSRRRPTPPTPPSTARRKKANPDKEAGEVNKALKAQWKELADDKSSRTSTRRRRRPRSTTRSSRRRGWRRWTRRRPG